MKYLYKVGKLSSKVKMMFSCCMDTFKQIDFQTFYPYLSGPWSCQPLVFCKRGIFCKGKGYQTIFYILIVQKWFSCHCKCFATLDVHKLVVGLVDANDRDDNFDAPLVFFQHFEIWIRSWKCHEGGCKPLNGQYVFKNGRHEGLYGTYGTNKNCEKKCYCVVQVVIYYCKAIVQSRIATWMFITKWPSLNY